jgi:hypothetical protein
MTQNQIKIDSNSKDTRGFLCCKAIVVHGTVISACFLGLGTAGVEGGDMIGVATSGVGVMVGEGDRIRRENPPLKAFGFIAIL